MLVTNQFITQVLTSFGFAYKMKDQKTMELGVHLDLDETNEDNTRIMIRKNLDENKCDFIFYENDYAEQKAIQEWNDEQQRLQEEANQNMDHETGSPVGDQPMTLTEDFSTDNGILIGSTPLDKPIYNLSAKGRAKFIKDFQAAIDENGLDLEFE